MSILLLQKEESYWKEKDKLGQKVSRDVCQICLNSPIHLLMVKDVLFILEGIKRKGINQTRIILFTYQPNFFKSSKLLDASNI